MPGQWFGGLYRLVDFLFRRDDNSDHEAKKDHTQPNRHPKENAFNAAAGSENTTCVGASQAAQPCTLALKDDAED